jgi:hypothetical protein
VLIDTAIRTTKGSHALGLFVWYCVSEYLGRQLANIAGRQVALALGIQQLKDGFKFLLSVASELCGFEKVKEQGKKEACAEARM